MRVDNVLNDSEAEPCPSLFARTALVGTEKTSEDMREVLFGYPYAVIGNLDTHLFEHIHETYTGLSAIVAIAYGVGYKVGQYLFYVFFVGVDHYRHFDFLNGYADPALVCLIFEDVDKFVGEKHDVEITFLEVYGPGLDLGYHIEVRYYPHKAVYVLFRAKQILPVYFLVLQGAVEQCGYIALDVEYRGFEFVGYVPDKFTAELLVGQQPFDLLLAGLDPLRYFVAYVFHNAVVRDELALKFPYGDVPG